MPNFASNDCRCPGCGECAAHERERKRVKRKDDRREGLEWARSLIENIGGGGVYMEYIDREIERLRRSEP